jgi:hypothetical protein
VVESPQPASPIIITIATENMPMVLLFRVFFTLSLLLLYVLSFACLLDRRSNRNNIEPNEKAGARVRNQWLCKQGEVLGLTNNVPLCIYTYPYIPRLNG